MEKYQSERGETLISIQGADIVNNGNLILSDVSLEVCKGDFIYLVGKVGSGKSSIIKSIIAEIPLHNGSASVGKYDLVKIKRKQIPFLRRGIGVVFQDFQLLMDRSVMENLIFVLEATGWKKKGDMIKRASEVLDMVGMATKAHKMPHQLSGGEQQRVVIARALLNNPPIILADEPTGNLDPDTTVEIMDLFMKIHKEYSPALIIVTHNRELVKRYPGVMMVCENGTLNMVETELEISFEDDILELGNENRL
ncbi:MAG: ATP-binding cassette domain-containing protein [Bacteroidales bacterium]|nr:ATP-binding cassette domain-containing protein [Bacteroidales bacterium]